jgi:hypothetical protein
LTGSYGADYFNCGPGTDTIVDFNAAKDSKTADCENVLGEHAPVSDNNDNNDNNANTTETDTTTTTSSTPSSGVAEDSPATEEEEDASSLPGTPTTTPTSSSNNSTETTEATATAEIQKTMEVLPDEGPPADGQEAEPPTNDTGGQ